jgi:PHD/YefM family antitoxin component YafN of YafNO toxin-antitoxin module
MPRVERFVLTGKGEKVVAIIPVEELELLEELEEQMDVQAAKAALAESDERISYQDLRRELGLE